MTTGCYAFLVPQTQEARNAIEQDFLGIDHFPFRLGRESRRGRHFISDGIDYTEKRTGLVPPNNDFYLMDEGEFLQISREHFQVERQEDGTFSIFDRASSCGTIVIRRGKETVIKGERLVLFPDDLIKIGSTRSLYIFRFATE